MNDKKEIKIEKIYFAYKYAADNGIIPTNPKTWDDNYKNRMKELAGIIPQVEEELKSLKEVLEIRSK